MQTTKTQPKNRLNNNPEPRYPAPPPARRQPPRAPAATEETARTLDRWADEELFEEDLRTVMQMMRPHRRERLMGWSEYRTGGRHFRATISWDETFAADASSQPDPQPCDDCFTIPNFADVLESLLIGSIRPDADLTPEQRTAAYQALLRDLTHRLQPRTF